MSEWKVVIFIITAFTIMLVLMATGVHWTIQVAAGLVAVYALYQLWTSLNRPPQQCGPSRGLSGISL